MAGLSFFDPMVNHFPDPGFEGGLLTSEYRFHGTGVVDSTQVTDTPRLEGDFSLRVSCSNPGSVASGGLLVVHGWYAPAAPDEPWSLGAEAGYVTVGARAVVRLNFLAPNLAPLATYTAESNVGQVVPQDVEIENVVAPATTAFVRADLGLRAEGAPAASQAMFDRVVLTISDEVMPFFSGDSGNSRWSGPSYASPSVRQGLAPAMRQIARLVPPFYTSEDGV